MIRNLVKFSIPVLVAIAAVACVCKIVKDKIQAPASARTFETAKVPGFLRDEDVKFLLKQLLGENASEARIACDILGRSDESVVPELVALLAPTNAGCINSCRTLERLNSKSRSAVPKLIELLDAEEPKIRHATVCALGAIGDRRAIDPILKLLQNETNIFVATASLRAIRGFEENPKRLELIPILIRQIDQPPRYVRKKKDGVVDYLEEHYYGYESGSVEFYHNKTVIISTSAFGLDAIPAIQLLLQDNSASMGSKRSAIFIVGRIMNQVKKSESRKRSALSITPVLVKSLTDSDDVVRHSAAYSLGKIGADAREALPQLRMLEKDLEQDELVRGAATKARTLIEIEQP